MSSADWPAGAREFATAWPVARLATCSADGMPHVVPICFALAGDTLYSIVDGKPKRAPTRMKRLRNIAENPRFAVVIDRYDEDWTRLEYVMLRGAATAVETDDEYAEAVVLLREKYPQYRSMAFDATTNPLLRLAIHKITHWRYAARPEKQ
jgi:coenzyme F420-0:L-glutamate ligase/coenzyme F420-1:gamma-L-glutamate ligase